MRRYGIFAQFDADGLWSPPTDALVRALAEVCDEVLVISAGGLRTEDRARAEAIRRVRVMERANVGHDFASYRFGLLQWRDKVTGHELLISNDSYVLPTGDVGTILVRADFAVHEVWGMTLSHEIAVHLQSYFLLFGPRVTADSRFWFWWEGAMVLHEKRHIIERYEVGLSKALRAWGYSTGALVRVTALDHLLGLSRVVCAQGLGPRAGAGEAGMRSGLIRLWRAVKSSFAYNPTHAFADQAFGGRELGLPIVKWEVLRDDPWGLGADRLVDATDQLHPDWDMPAEVRRRRLASTAAQHRTKGRFIPWPVAYRPSGGRSSGARR